MKTFEIEYFHFSFPINGFSYDYVEAETQEEAMEIFRTDNPGEDLSIESIRTLPTIPTPEEAKEMFP